VLSPERAAPLLKAKAEEFSKAHNERGIKIIQVASRLIHPFAPSERHSNPRRKLLAERLSFVERQQAGDRQHQGVGVLG